MSNPLSITFTREFETETSVPQDFVIENLHVIAAELHDSGVPVMHHVETQLIRDTIHAFTIVFTSPGFNHTVEGMVFHHSDNGETIIRGKVVAARDLSLLMIVFAVLFMSVHMMTVPTNSLYMLNHALFMTGGLLVGMWLLVYWLAKQIERRDHIVKACYEMIDGLEAWYAADGNLIQADEYNFKPDDLLTHTLRMMRLRK